jgi:precorrin-6B methylase 2
VLSKRLHGAFIRDASLKPNVAAAMIMMSGMRSGMTLVDPFVGSGTIVLEAAMMFPSGRFIGVERSERVVQGARDNARGLGLEDRVELIAGNARVLKDYTGSGAADVIVTNPPWGVRLGKCDDIDELYRGFLQAAADVLRAGGRLVIIVLRWESFLQFARQSGRWIIERAAPVRTGDLVTVVFVMRRAADEVWNETKAKVKAMAAVLTEGDGSYTPPPPKSRPEVHADAADAAAASSTDAPASAAAHPAASGGWGRKKGGDRGDAKKQGGGSRVVRERKGDGIIAVESVAEGEAAAGEDRRPRRVSQ